VGCRLGLPGEAGVDEIATLGMGEMLESVVGQQVQIRGWYADLRAFERRVAKVVGRHKDLPAGIQSEGVAVFALANGPVADRVQGGVELLENVGSCVAVPAHRLIA
jgi:hypothetical protein